MRRPILSLIIPIVLGIIVAYFIDLDNIFPLILLGFFFCLFFYNYKRKVEDEFSIYFILFLLGILLLNYKSVNSKLVFYVDELNTYTGLVTDTVKEEENESSYYVNIKDKSLKISEKISLKIYGEKKLKIGDYIRFDAVLQEPLTNTNPYLFNYKLHLLNKNIYTHTYVLDHNIEIIESDYGNFLIKLRHNFINNVEDLFDSTLDEKNSGLMKSIVLAKSYYLDEDYINIFRDIGLSHILAVSGLHIGIISLFILSLLAFLGLNRRINISITLIIIWLYALIIGLPPSVFRACTMFTILLIGQVSLKPYDSINALAIAFFILILINPYHIFGIGFQLSFMASLSILYLYPILGKYFNTNNKITKVVLVLLSIQIGLLPIQFYYFNKINLITIIANLILVPLFSLSLNIGILMIIFSYISRIITLILASSLNLLLNFEFSVLSILDKIDIFTIRIKTPSFALIVIYYLMIIIIVYWRDFKFDFNIRKFLYYYLIFHILYSLFSYNFNNNIKINFIDIGQGDSILIRSNRGNFLLDTGGNIFDGFNSGEGILLPYLEKNGIFSLSGVFISHFHIDHAGNLPVLQKNIKIDNIYVSYQNKDNQIYNEVIDKDLADKIIKLEADNVLILDKNTYFKILGPNEINGSDNDMSMVIELSHFNNTVLFTGDIEEFGEKSLLKAYNKKIDILKVPHHGSNTSSSREFIESLEPDYGIISVGRKNFFNHPGKEVIDRYNEYKVKILRTDIDGNIELTLNRKTYNIKSFLDNDLKLKNFIGEYGLIVLLYILLLNLLRLFTRFYFLKKEELKHEL